MPNTNSTNSTNNTWQQLWAESAPAGASANPPQLTQQQLEQWALTLG